MDNATIQRAVADYQTRTSEPSPWIGSRCYKVTGADPDTGKTRAAYVVALDSRGAREEGFASGLLVSKVQAIGRVKHGDARLSYAVERGVFRALIKFTIILVIVQILLGLLAWRILASEGVI